MSKEKLSRNEVRKKIIITLAQNNDGKIQKQTTEVMGIEIPENVVVTENTVDFLTTRIIERPLSDEQDAFLIAYIQNTDSIEEKQKYAWMFALKKRGFFISLLQKRFIGQELEDALVSAYIKLVDRILKPEFTCPITALYWKKLFSSIAAEVLTDKTFNTVVDNRDTFFASYQDNGYINKIHNIYSPQTFIFALSCI